MAKFPVYCSRRRGPQARLSEDYPRIKAIVRRMKVLRIMVAQSRGNCSARETEAWLENLEGALADLSHDECFDLMERDGREAFIEYNPQRVAERRSCVHDLDANDFCRKCRQSFAVHLSLKGAGLL